MVWYLHVKTVMSFYVLVICISGLSKSDYRMIWTGASDKDKHTHACPSINRCIRRRPRHQVSCWAAGWFVLRPARGERVAVGLLWGARFGGHYAGEGMPQMKIFFRLLCCVDSSVATSSAFITSYLWGQIIGVLELFQGQYVCSVLSN